MPLTDYMDKQRSRNLFQTSDINPDKRAESIYLNEKLKSTYGESLPLETIEENPTDYRNSLQNIEINRLDYSKAPVVNKTLANPVIAPVWKDDARNAVETENMWAHFATRWKLGNLNVELGTLGFKALRGRTSPEEDRIIKDFTRQQQELARRRPGWRMLAIPYEVVEQFPLMMASFSRSFYDALAGATVGTLAAGPGPGTVAGLGAGVAVGMGRNIYALESGSFYNEVRDMKDNSGKPVPEWMKVGAAVTYGTMAAAIEMGSDVVLGGHAVKLVKGLSRRTAKDMLSVQSSRVALQKAGIGLLLGAEGVAINGAEEGLQESLNILGVKTLEAYAGIEGAGFTESMQRIAEATKKGSMAGAGLGVIGAAPMAVALQQRVARMDKNAEIASALSGVSEKSKILQKYPRQYQQFVKDVIREHGAAETVGVPLTTLQFFLAENNIDVARDMPQIQASVEDATREGGEVQIPTQFFIDNFARSEKFAQHMNDVRMHPEMLTANESKAIGDAIAQQAVVQATDPIYLRFKQHLSERLGTPEQADLYAQLLAAAYINMGERAGQTPEQMAERFVLRAGREDAETADIEGIVDMIQSGAVPEGSQIYGPDLQEFTKGMPESEGLRKAVEAGYFESDQISLEKYREALKSDEPVYAYGKADLKKARLAKAAQEVSDIAEAMGIDIKTATPEQVAGQIRGRRMEQKLFVPRTISAVTKLERFEKKGSIPVSEIAALKKQKGVKAIEKEIIDQTLALPEFQGKKRIPYDAFMLSVSHNLMPLEQIPTNRYNGWGADNFGFEYDVAKTILYNAPVTHGKYGHFPEAFQGKAKIIQYELVETQDPNTGQNYYAAVEVDHPPVDQDHPEELMQYIGTAGTTRESVERWILDQEGRYTDDEAHRIGLFGHTRRWDVGDDRYVAETQSDYYQKNHPAEGISLMIVEQGGPGRRGLISAYKRNIEDSEKAAQENPKLKEAHRYVKSNSDIILKIRDKKKKLAKGGANYKAVVSVGYGHYSNARWPVHGEKIQQDISPEQEVFIFYDYERKRWVISAVGYEHQVLYRKEKQVAIDAILTWMKNHPETDVSAYPGAIESPAPEIDRVISDIEKSSAEKIEWAGAEDYRTYTGFLKRAQDILRKALPKTFNASERQFVAHAKNFEERMLREEIRQAAIDDKERLLFPSPFTVSLIEGYIQPPKGHRGYEVTVGDEDDIRPGDMIYYDGADHRVMEVYQDEIIVIEERDVSSIDVSEWRNDQIYNRIRETMYELPAEIRIRDLDSQEYYGEIYGNDLINMAEDYIARVYAPQEVEDKGGMEEFAIDSDDLSTEVEEYVESNYEEYDWHEDIAETYYDQMIAHDYKYGTVYVGSYNSEPVGLPNRAAKGEIDIEEIDKAVEEFKLEDLSDREQRVVERYIELPQLLEVLKPGQVVSTRDENGYPWLSIPIEKDDATAPIRLFQEMRGYIDISERSDFFKITLTGEANLSTFLHESGHMFLEIMRNLALDPNSKDEIKQMYATVERWLGVEPGQELTRDQHEQWARGFELYLRSGKAPSIELASAFRRFSQWLKRIYLQASDLQVVLPEEVTDVMDRMIASDGAIKLASDISGSMPAFNSAEHAGMNPVEWNIYLQQFAGAMADGERRMFDTMMGDLRRQRSGAYKQDKRDLELAVADDVASRPVYAALNFMQTGLLPDTNTIPASLLPGKLDRDAVKALYFRDPQILRKLPRGITQKNGSDPDIVARYFGFDNAHDMLQTIRRAKPQAQAIRDEVKQKLDAVYGNSMTGNDRQLATMAFDALHNDQAEQFHIKELRIFSGKYKRPLPPGFVRQAQLYADQRIAGMKAGALQSANQFLTAEQRAGKEAVQAAAKNDWAAASEAKRRQLINFWLYRKAIAAKKEIDRTYRYLKPFTQTPKRKKLGLAGGNYLEAVDVILDKLEFRKVSGPQLQRRKSLEAYLSSIEDEGQMVQIDEKTRAELNLRNFSDLRFEEIQSIRDAVKNIDKLASLKLELLIGRDKRNFRKTADSVAAKIRASVPAIKRSKMHNPSFWDRTKSKIRGFDAETLKAEFLIEQLDGGQALGIVHEMLFQPFEAAQFEYYNKLKELNKKLIEPIRKAMAKDRKRQKRYGRKQQFAGGNFYGHEILGIALNVGNESNLDKLLRGYADEYGWTEEGLMEALDGWMEKEDWDIVRKVWDATNRYWPEIEALNKKYVGLAPPKVEGRFFKTRHGLIAGAYYPVIYDRRRAYRQHVNAVKKVNDMFENSLMRQNVSAGFTEARTNVAYPIMLSIEPLGAHLNEVLHYLTHYESVRNVYRLLQDKEVRSAIAETAGQEYHDALVKWVNYIANDGSLKDEFAWPDRFASHMATGVSITAMCANLSTAVVQIVGLASSVHRVGYGSMVKGIMDVMKSPVQAAKGAESRYSFAIENSKELPHLIQTFDRDARSMANSMMLYLAGQNKAFRINANLVAFGFGIIGRMQRLVSAATWLAAYDKSIKTMEHKKAASEADSTVRKTQSGGGAKDLAAIQRNRGMYRLITAFYTYFSSLYGLLRATGIKGKTKPWQAMADFSSMILLAVALEKVLRDGFPDDDEPIEEWVKDYGAGVATFMFATIPVARDIANGVFTDYGYNFSPVGQMTSRMSRTARKTFTDKELTESDWKNIIDTIGTVAHMPTKPIRRGWDYYQAYVDGDIEEPFREFIFGVKEK